jgi:Protein of unknown function (DUF3551)
MRRAHCSKISLALGLFGVLTVSTANAQTVRSYCLTGINGELGHCDYPTFDACRVDGAGYGTCIASERPVSGESAAAAAVPTTKRRR